MTLRDRLSHLAIVAALSLAPEFASAQACACPATRPPAIALAESDAVFEGQVTGVRDGPYVASQSDTMPGRWVTLLVLREWKGATAGTTRYVFTPSACDVPFEAGTTWLVYARHSGANHDLRTTRCHRTRPVATAREDLIALGIPGTQIMAMQPANPTPRRAVSRAPARRVRRVVRRRRR